MIRHPLLTALALLPLAGCTAHGASIAERGSADAPTVGAECRADRLERFMNAAPTKLTLAQLRMASGAQVLRIIRPGDMVTMDYRPDRLNVEVGEDGRIKRLRCG